MSATRDDHTLGIDAAPEALRNEAAVRWWLYAIAALIAAMVMVGGATRLTDSGLSITEWQLISGFLPPLTDAAWATAFEKYREIPEYQLVNRGMSLEEFKFIFWWEWGHRFLGRMIGFAFAVPLVIFWLRGMLSRGLKPKLLLMLVLGGLQGALGWYMVQSGLVDRVDVSQYRLAAHLGLAVATFCYVLWVALELRPATERSAASGPMIAALCLTVLIFVQLLIGGLVAGLDAGHGYNTWPLMDGALIPDGLGAMTPVWINLFENAMTVQFVHRMVAYLIVVLTLAYGVSVLRREGEGTLAMTAVALILSVLVQVGLGVATLLYSVPITLALLHQGFALVLIGLFLVHLHVLQRG